MTTRISVPGVPSIGKRRSIAVTLLAIAAGALTVYYLDGVAGSDTNDGLSAATAWQTSAKAAGFTYPAGGITLQFKGGQTYADFTPPRQGSASAPITITSYGLGQAVFAGGPNSGAFYFPDLFGGLVFDNINCAGFGFDTTSLSGTADFVQIKNCTIGDWGAYFGGDTGTAGYSNVLIDNNTLTDGGISCYPSNTAAPAATRVHTNFTVTNNRITGAGNGNGIAMGGASNVLVQGNTVVGAKDYHGIWCYATDNFTFRQNTVSGTLPPAGRTSDGNGVSADEDTSNGVIEQNLTYNNTGAGFILSAFASAGNGNNGSISNVTMRHNISVNDCTGTVMVASLQLVTNGSPSTLTGCSVHSNTFYQSRSGKYCAAVTSADVSAHVANNIFQTWGNAAGSITTFTTLNPSSCLFSGNAYAGSSTSIKWNGTTYTGPSSWRAAFTTQEDVSGSPAYVTADPQLLGGGTLVASDYYPTIGSAMIGGGLDLQTLFGISPGTQDYFGNAISTPLSIGAAHIGGVAAPSWITSGADIDIDFMNGRFYGGSQASMLSCSRASTGYAKNAAGMLVSFAANTPRLTDLGLLIEEARTNMCLASQSFTNATYWSVAAGATIATTSAVPDPTGATGAFIYNEGTGTTVHNMFMPAAGNAGFTSGTIYCLSMFFKAGTGSLVQITPALALAGGGPYANFDLNAGTVTSTGGGLVGSGIVPYGNGWYRCWMAFTCTGTASAGADGFLMLNVATATRAPTYTGSSRTVYTWGAQTEALPASGGSMGPSSYIVTTTAQVTRPADNISASGALFNKLKAANIPGVRAKFSRDAGSFFQGVFSAGDGTTNNRNTLGFNTTNQANVQAVLGGSAQIAALTANTVSTAGTAVSLAARMKSGDQSLSLNNGAAGTSTAASYGAASQVTIGSTSNALTSMLNGYLKQLTTFSADQTNASLASLSTP